MSESKFFCFDDELQSKARYVIDLEKDNYEVSDLGGSRFALTSSDGSNHHFEASSSKESGEWVELLLSAGAEFRKEPIETTAS